MLSFDTFRKKMEDCPQTPLKWIYKAVYVNGHPKEHYDNSWAFIRGLYEKMQKTKKKENIKKGQRKKRTKLVKRSKNQKRTEPVKRAKWQPKDVV